MRQLVLVFGELGVNLTPDVRMGFAIVKPTHRVKSQFVSFSENMEEDKREINTT